MGTVLLVVAFVALALAILNVAAKEVTGAARTVLNVAAVLLALVLAVVTFVTIGWPILTGIGA